MDKEEAWKRFLANPYWKKYYDEAPSEECKEYIKWIFICSDVAELPEEYDKQLKSAEENLYYSDLEYLIEHEENAMARSYFKKKLAKKIRDTAI